PPHNRKRRREAVYAPPRASSVVAQPAAVGPAWPPSARPRPPETEDAASPARLLGAGPLAGLRFLSLPVPCFARRHHLPGADQPVLRRALEQCLLPPPSATPLLLPEVSLPLPGKWERGAGVSEEGREVLLLPQQAAREPEGAG